MNIQNGGFGCAEHEAQMEGLLFGELQGAEKEALEHHLEVCPRCRRALEEAKHGLEALSSLKEAPLPYSEHQSAVAESSQTDIAWVDFRRRLSLTKVAEEKAPPRAISRWWSDYRLAAAAALVIVGIAVGRWTTPQMGSPERSAAPGASVQDVSSLASLTVEAQAVEALARAEILADVGLRYVTGLQDMLHSVTDLSVRDVSATDMAVTRERARDLIRDGRLLRRSLDHEKDVMFLDAISRAEIFLEELAALEVDPSGANVRIVQAALRKSQLSNKLSALNVENEVALALEASGWIGQELVQRKEF
jgi:hypothetical protein